MGNDEITAERTTARPKRVGYLRRVAVALVAVAGIGAGLGSSAPQANAVINSASSLSAFRFDGGGWGHGVGMSQYGAYGMAQNGASAGQILAKYYLGTELRQLPQPNDVRIWLDEVSGTSGFRLAGAGFNVITYRSADGRAVATSQPAEQILLRWINGRFVFRTGTIEYPLDGVASIFIELGGSPVAVEPIGNRYRFGRLELLPQPDSSIRIVAAGMTMEQYLAGLGEVPSGWPMEALKAQAIAARSYALERIKRLGLNRAVCSCSLYGTVSDQNYEGYEKEAAAGGARWVQAVTETAGVVSTYNGDPIQAYYSSSSGGHTEASEDGFSAVLPYLRAVPDAEDALSPNFKWTQEYTSAELTRWFDANPATTVGAVARIELLEPFTSSGRVGRVLDANRGGVRIVGSTGTKRVSGQTLQTVINRGVYAEGFGYARELRSALYRVSGGGSAFDAYDPRFGGGLYAATGATEGTAGRVITGAGAGGGPHVRVLDDHGGQRAAFFAYDPRFEGGVRVASCDLDGDGKAEIITGPGPGGGPHVQIFRGDGTLVRGFFAFDGSFLGGLYVACGNVTGDSRPEIVVGAGPSRAPLVHVFSADGSFLGGWLAYPAAFGGGVRVAVVDLDGNGPNFSAIVTGPGPGGGPHVVVREGGGTVIRHFMALDGGYVGGVYVAGGDLTGDSGHEIVVGSGELGVPQVVVFNAAGQPVANVSAAVQGAGIGVRVAAGSVSGDKAVVAGSGPGGKPTVALFKL